MRLSAIVNPTVRCGAVIHPTVRFGAVLKNRKSYGAGRCGFENTKSYGAVRCCDISYGAVQCGFQKPGILRRGSPLNGFLYGAAPLSVGKSVQRRFFSTVHQVNKPYKTRQSHQQQQVIGALKKDSINRFVHTYHP